jgi:membrane protease YdiL (CAAX protease family)
VQSFVFLTVASVGTLWLLGRFEALQTLPPEFAALMPPRPAPASLTTGSAEHRVGVLTGFSVSVLLSLLIWRRRMKAATLPIIPELEPLIPRTAAERWTVLPLCLNAGFSEELFFRLALPLLLTVVTGSALSALVISVGLFGLMHWYQGWRGILGTTLVGGLLTFAYLASGSLLRVMIMHALIDVIALLVRPALVARAARGAALMTPATQPD